MLTTATITSLKEELSKIILGRDDTIDLLLTCLVAGGHALLEDYPGSGKTTIAKTLGGLISSQQSDSDILPFRRLQFTPDLLPSDVLGVNIFEPSTSSFKFLPGPIFAHIVLADEINRTGPKVQAAFLECMAEKQVTIDNQTRKLDELFFVIGTQNPLDMAGTYPLPLVQLDRFLLRIPMTYVDASTELQILKNIDNIDRAISDLKPIVSREEILEAQKSALDVSVSETILKAIVDIVQSTRNNPLLQYSASTRSAIMLKRAVSAHALIKGRDYVSEDDLKTLAPHVLGHRLKFHASAGDSNKAMSDLLEPHLEKLITGVWS